MSKLFTLKAWLTVPDTARHLSIIFGEEVTEADVLRLALDGHLKLSVHFVNDATGRRGKIIPISDAEYKEAASLEGKRTIRIYGGVKLFATNAASPTEIIMLENEVISLAGVFDLPMIGAERLDVEHTYQNLTSGPDITGIGLDGAFVEGQDGQLFQLLEKFHDKKVRKSGPQLDNYFPAGGLPTDSVLVVRASALQALQASLAEIDKQTVKPLSERAETTYLNIIGGLLGLMLSDTPAGKPQSVFKDQSAIIDSLMARYENKSGIKKRTLEQKFAAAKRSIEAG